MPAKAKNLAGVKRAKTAAADPVVADEGLDEEPIVTVEMAKYYAKVDADIAVIVGQWPNIVSTDALPETGTSGFKSLVGYGSPFNPEVYDARFPEPDFAYKTHVNLLWQNMKGTVLSFVPLYWDRVLDLAEVIDRPTVLKRDMVFLANFNSGDTLPRGGLNRLSPCEEVHATVHKIADRIRACAPPEELDQWLRVILSAPAQFMKIAIGDKQYAEVNSLRQDAASVAEAVTFSARQLVYNINGFKASHEKRGDALTAEQVAKFYETEVRTSKKHRYLTKKSTIDVCLTIKSRMYSIPGAEEIIARDEADHGTDSFWNHLWKQQEIIYRARTPPAILWLMTDLSDQLARGGLTNNDVSVSSIKTGAKSLSDPILCRLTLRDYLLGSWLDALGLPAYMVQKCREIFKDHAAYRALYNPLVPSDAECVAIVDTTWFLKWPQCGKEVVDFLESTIYTPHPGDLHVLRQAVKNNATCDEILANESFANALASIRTKISATGTPDAVSGVGCVPPSNGIAQHGPGGGPCASVTEAARDESEVQLDQATERTMRKLIAYIEESQSFTALRDLFSATPLAMIQPSAESGNVMILGDMNTFGETDSRPDRRSCPIAKDKIENLLRAIVSARYGREDPPQLTVGEFYCCISGGRDRKRTWTKPLQNANMKKGRDPNRLFTRVITIHMKESALRVRRHRQRGQVKLTQQSYMCGNRESFTQLTQREYPIHGGSIATDLLGPVIMDPLSAIPKMTQADKKLFWAKRFVLAGGAVPRDGLSDDDVETSDQEQIVQDDDSDPQYPINYHCLPLSVVLDKVAGFNVKHVIDLAPTPLNLSFHLAKRGVSYVALCASPMMKDFLKKQAFTDIRKAITNENEAVLYDPRFKGTHSLYAPQRSIT